MEIQVKKKHQKIEKKGMKRRRKNNEICCANFIVF